MSNIVMKTQSGRLKVHTSPTRSMMRNRQERVLTGGITSCRQYRIMHPTCVRKRSLLAILIQTQREVLFKKSNKPGKVREGARERSREERGRKCVCVCVRV